ncbi:LapA family protein [Isachenkonia alkalipeptolytica]|uniref:LapA family protein n=1 Tax=Isachenkonia alkalipeptolytica TaxID=2565777 RepID=A0AA44BE16_9CLOT|nr:LapA family protein [Isachenkonia alkalipeptolytica]NBG88904.1 LapA family protein [Isachenkonia alkalipeptolytica]
MQKNLIITLILSIFIALFAILNAGAVSINLLFTTLEISAALVILISATIGAVIVFFLDTASKYRYRKQIKESQKHSEKMEKEKEELEEKNRWYEKELARLREQNLGQILEKDSAAKVGRGKEGPQEIGRNPEEINNNDEQQK